MKKAVAYLLPFMEKEKEERLKQLGITEVRPKNKTIRT
jgi:cobalamin-dependent methionine synthase I